MPWRETSPMDQRRRFIGDYYRQFVGFSELCARYGISRRIGYKWLERYETAGPPGLADRSRRPHTSPTATPLPVVEQLAKYWRGDVPLPPVTRLPVTSYPPLAALRPVEA